MAKKNKIYVTTMFRWGEYDNHSYIVYVGNSKSKALSHGAEEENQRGNKYSHQVLEFEPNTYCSCGDTTHKVIKEPVNFYKSE